MKHVFLDTNILVDLLAVRPPFSKFAIEIFANAEQRKVKLYTSSHSIATTYYLLKKHIDDTTLREALLSVLDLIEVIAVEQHTIRKSLLSKHKDFEDAIQITAANTVGNIDFIVTRNLKDFKNTGIITLPPDEVLNYI